jgi:hypothetical protein
MSLTSWSPNLKPSFKKEWAWYAGRFTQRGLREFYFYALDTVDYVQSSVSILQKHSKFPFLVKAVYDKE